MNLFANLSRPKRVSDPQHNQQLHVEPLESRMMLSTVEIFAAGATGEEQLDVFIDDQYQASFLNVGGDPSARDFQVFTYETDQTLAADQVGIAFGNDSYNPETGFDRNLYVDKIVIDGVTFETEDPSTVSTGIWRNGGYTGPGNFETEEFNTNAIFTYSSFRLNARTLIEIDVLAEEGEEIAELLIVRGAEVDSREFRFRDTAGQRQTLEFFTDIDADLSDVRFSFTNDRLSTRGTFDYNLVVYSLKATDQVTGEVQFAETTDSNVFSTGVFRESDGIQPGFGRGPLLYTNGFIEVQAPIVAENFALVTGFGQTG